MDWSKLSSKWNSFNKQEQIAIGVVVAFVSFFVLSLMLIALVPAEEPAQPANLTQPATSDVTHEKPKFEKLDRSIVRNVRAQEHYLYTEGSKPTQKEIEDKIMELVANGCDEYSICEFFIWDSKEGYDNRENTEGLSNEVATANKKHLAGFLNSGYAFYYYGESGAGDSLRIYDPEAKTFTNF